ncbi:DUF4406 domain-containing protein [Carnobacterium maltaromaticum]|uniref:DUF7768 domain-containing protein n=1 Tax=Carnobacterium maltaromaticum TaxID=2751 RepID=UPI0010744DC9|nr:DUF4406 domain-containing protein [Carnobacterium maltaromaticum]TFJ55463.1 DUF4406 domain-containing protein [Carnobacterium maltaromaticum]
MTKRKDYRKTVYICSPFSENVSVNIENTKRYCRFAVEHGYMPVASHLLYPQFMDDATERDVAMHMSLVLMGKCEEVWVVGCTISDGMAIEIEQAKYWKKHIHYFNEEMKEVSNA